MTVYFADSSALAKRYIETESGASWVVNEAMPTSDGLIIITDFTVLELSAIFSRRSKDPKWQAGYATQLKQAFLYHVLNEYISLPLDKKALKFAEELTEKHLLRAGDSIQLASAVMARTIFSFPIVFMCSDMELLKAAAAEGFATEDPKTHP